MLVRTPGARGQRPSGPVVLNRDSPLAQGLGVWIPDNRWDYARNVGPVQKTPPTRRGDSRLLYTDRFVAGSSQYVDFPHVPWLDNCAKATFAFWQSDPVAASYGHRITQQTQYAGSNSGFSILEGGSSADELWFTARDSTADNASATGFSVSPCRVVVVYDGAATPRFRVYRNGVEVSVSGPNNAVATLPTTTEYFSVGRGNGASPNYYGSVDVTEIRGWGRALSAAEVWADYDPATRWDLYWQPSTRAYAWYLPVAGGSFNPAWAAGSNQIVGWSPC